MDDQPEVPCATIHFPSLGIYVTISFGVSIVFFSARKFDRSEDGNVRRGREVRTRGRTLQDYRVGLFIGRDSGPDGQGVRYVVSVQCILCVSQHKEKSDRAKRRLGTAISRRANRCGCCRCRRHNVTAHADKSRMSRTHGGMAPTRAERPLQDRAPPGSTPSALLCGTCNEPIGAQLTP